MNASSGETLSAVPLGKTVPHTSVVPLVPVSRLAWSTNSSHVVGPVAAGQHGGQFVVVVGRVHRFDLNGRVLLPEARRQLIGNWPVPLRLAPLVEVRELYDGLRRRRAVPGSAACAVAAGDAN